MRRRRYGTAEPGLPQLTPARGTAICSCAQNESPFVLHILGLQGRAPSVHSAREERIERKSSCLSSSCTRPACGTRTQL